MKPLVIITFLLVVQPILSIQLKDILPIKYDVVKVRTEEELQHSPTAVLDFIGLVERHGYTAEEHKVTTRDGYILVLHRITGSPLNPRAPGKPVVFLQHGLLFSSDAFVLIGPGKDLAFLLADAGYDIWLGNARGNTYSRSHVSLSPKQKKFWEFSFHEIGVFDLSASIDFVLSMTNSSRLIFIGYSMGTTEIFALLSTLPEYNEKISVTINLAPIVFWTQKLPLQMKLVIDNVDTIKKFISQHQYYELFPQSMFMAKLGKIICGNRNTKHHLNKCKAFFTVALPIMDYNRVNKTKVSDILSYFPSGTSLHTFLHYAQNAISGDFRKYNYESQVNLTKSSSSKAPKYDLNRVTVPVALFFGEKDYFTTPENSKRLRTHLPNVVVFKKIANDRFNHLDFLFATDVKKLLYNDILKIVDTYSDTFYRQGRYYYNSISKSDLSR